MEDLQIYERIQIVKELAEWDMKGIVATVVMVALS